MVTDGSIGFCNVAEERTRIILALIIPSERSEGQRCCSQELEASLPGAVWCVSISAAGLPALPTQTHAAFNDENHDFAETP
jgi:hypothetical protein